MMEHLASLLNLLCCPDDGQPLRFASTGLLCNGCGRNFPLHARDVLELLPSCPVPLPESISAEYRDAYLRLFKQPFQEDGRCLAWGAEETVPQGWVRKRGRQVSAVRTLVTENVKSNTVLCDIAAGAGYYTFAYQRYFSFVLHCDLSVSNLNYASRRAREKGLGNILFLRIDYFQPPFRHSLDRLLCLDTLIRGEKHDCMLLSSIARCLKPEGSAIVDFHNWWHNPLRRVGILPENFHNNRSYRRSETKELLRDAGIQEANFFRFVQEFDTGTPLEKLCSRAVPATRLVYQFGGGADAASQAASLASAQQT
jgi:SAM-dependent methyltransferase/uncharacterized protein YbaR (Trm112 family)